MAKANQSSTTEFILIGFTDHPELKVLLFVVFFVIYLVTMVGNLGLVALIYMERRLHTPMYIFLGNLALMDSCCSSAITPKILKDLFSEDKMISLYECMVQFYFLCVAETADCFLLAAMAYDRYVAICSPLQYHTRMSKKLCIQMSVASFITSNLHSMIHVGFLLRLTFCKSNQIDHFFCDILPLFRLSCTDPYINELMIYIFSMPIQVFTIATVLVSYLCILYTIFKMTSKDGRGKAFSTCASHFFSVSIFYICLLMYIRPFEEGDKDIPVAIFYTIIIPLLNPFIYSLRNKEVIDVLKKTMKTYNILKITYTEN
ncbi:olfactory receptor Olfr180-like [Perognathus longimembris pacificus]|uniref:olfactory receptor Olfr180-like n=1 Tax=Perognathus longimembris pacificus TaxID=214514 RepID=UPI002019BE15|nr:olfactory receptor Olfr180-like [Perognathus longimembris pacificus]